MAKGITIPAQLWLPIPIASDGFVGANGTALSAHPTDGGGHPEANGGVGKIWTHDVGAWALNATNKAVGTPTLGAELLTDGGVENWTSATDLTSWTETIGGTTTVNREGTIIHGGTYAARIDVDATPNIGGITQGTHITGQWYQATAWLRSGVGTQLAGMWHANSGRAFNISTTYTQYITVYRAPNTNTGGLFGYTASNSYYMDDASWVALTLSSLFSTVNAGTSNVKVRAKVAALTAGTQAGVVIINNAATPTQGIVAYFAGDGNVKVDEFTAAATWNALATAAKTFTAADELELDISGTAWRCYHITASGTAVLIGSGTFTASLGTASQVGLFSTYSGNSFSVCSIWAKGTESQYSILDQLGA